MEHPTWIAVQGIKTRYFDAGSGPPLVLLHGMSATAECWYYPFESLKNRFRVIAPDLPGHGRSARAERRQTLELYTEWLAALFDALGVEHAVLVGNSMGGAISMAFALTFPNRVDRLVLAAPALASARIDWLMPLRTLVRVPHLLAAVTTHRADPHYLRFVRRRLVFDPWGPAREPLERMIRTNAGRGLKVYRAGMDFLLSDYLPPHRRRAFVRHLAALRMPILLMWGREDRVLPVWQGISAARSIPGARLHIFELCSHCPMMEVPIQFERVLLDFLQDNDAAHP
ncbi:MAG: alpha/beta hydrolase [Anaerolineae bacterium]